ncbi:HflX GTPase family protein [Micromonospora fulviviridis]|uniref:HflX GTPase family protein n=1 Tax=Micromonospora fulviviridis TaxID=47860 RepID=UPI0037A22C7D
MAHLLDPPHHLTVADAVVQNRPRPDPATFVGSGKVDELAAVAERTHADVVIADGELSRGQVRNLEERTGVRVVDRAALILDIFAEHARTSEGRVQVELAQIAYQLPGCAGTAVRCPAWVVAGWPAAPAWVPSVAITGYTNAGKSALLNRLTGADAQVQDVLFATLDPTVRRLSTGDLTYTVGFVRHLPHQLVDVFRSTLEEVSGSDLVLHVVDAAAPDALEQITTVHGGLHEIGAGDVPELLALNKIDVVPAEWVAALCRACPEAVPVSALTGEGVDRLRAELAARLGRR